MIAWDHEIASSETGQPDGQLFARTVLGEPEKADHGMLPDNYSCDSPAWQSVPGYMHYDTNYLLICDNLLDFSHLSCVHEKTLGGSTAIAQLARPLVATLCG